MPQIAACQHCRSSFTVPDGFDPSRHQCPKCHQPLNGRHPATAAPAPANVRGGKLFPFWWAITLAVPFVVLLIHASDLNGENYAVRIYGGVQVIVWGVLAYFTARAVDRFTGRA